MTTSTMFLFLLLDIYFLLREVSMFHYGILLTLWDTIHLKIKHHFCYLLEVESKASQYIMVACGQTTTPPVQSCVKLFRKMLL